MSTVASSSSATTAPAALAATANGRRGQHQRHKQPAKSNYGSHQQRKVHEAYDSDVFADYKIIDYDNNVLTSSADEGASVENTSWQPHLNWNFLDWTPAHKFNHQASQRELAWRKVADKLGPLLSPAALRKSFASAVLGAAHNFDSGFGGGGGVASGASDPNAGDGLEKVPFLDRNRRRNSVQRQAGGKPARNHRASNRQRASLAAGFRAAAPALSDTDAATLNARCNSLDDDWPAPSSSSAAGSSAAASSASSASSSTSSLVSNDFGDSSHHARRQRPFVVKQASVCLYGGLNSSESSPASHQHSTATTTTTTTAAAGRSPTPSPVAASAPNTDERQPSGDADCEPKPLRQPPPLANFNFFNGDQRQAYVPRSELPPRAPVSLADMESALAAAAFLAAPRGGQPGRASAAAKHKHHSLDIDYDRAHHYDFDCNEYYRKARIRCVAVSSVIVGLCVLLFVLVVLMATGVIQNVNHA